LIAILHIEHLPAVLCSIDLPHVLLESDLKREIRATEDKKEEQIKI
jgi:hypothetical protein